MTILSLMAKEKSQEKGEMLKLIRLVSKKIERGYDVTLIAELFEKPPALIGALYEIISENPGKGEEEWYDIFLGEMRFVA